MKINSLDGSAGYIVLMGHVSVIISYSSCCLTTETEKHINENHFMKEIGCIKIQYMSRREANECKRLTLGRMQK